jgi:chromosome partitioning protein
MRKICVGLSKGGVGKSSTSVSLAHGLAIAGRKVLLIDTDDQGQDAFLLGIKPNEGLAEVLDKNKAINKVLLEARDNLWLLCGGKALSGAKRMIGRKDFGGEQTLAEALSPLEDEFDYIIIDTSPSWDALTINSLFYATEVLTPVSLEILTINSLLEFSKSLTTVQRFNKNLSHRYVLPTFLDGRVKKSEEILGQLKHHYKDQLCHPIKYSVRLSEAPGFGQTIFEFAKTSTGAKDYQKLVTRILKDE